MSAQAGRGSGRSSVVKGKGKGKGKAQAEIEAIDGTNVHSFVRATPAKGGKGSEKGETKGKRKGPYTRKGEDGSTSAGYRLGAGGLTSWDADYDPTALQEADEAEEEEDEESPTPSSSSEEVVDSGPPPEERDLTIDQARRLMTLARLKKFGDNNQEGK
mmetsp:Transcript_20258/g.44236  ORF Transcript_20258/g.44236 Transcript_20258/m.44236 type:complete len:159 (-) Transcript_20258:276-752(-)|eukprot:CAMPEP_0206491624 /NCGR_PEP_ID=MMETSP0324_2-20121206/45217_1 /ASSEMBLY_ACC=CAM_ASM_000836 /TAXON_ID=2866 /ORGANISM="Crypthecodinium cohnii, Strain Seligo" /LENGTH=158 /DNA_ID=CAMNT_0053973071 /DNA_START=38 /DNA_END=514 /DNA_ORIENTATION=+